VLQGIQQKLGFLANIQWRAPALVRGVTAHPVVHDEQMDGHRLSSAFDGQVQRQFGKLRHGPARPGPRRDTRTSCARNAAGPCRRAASCRSTGKRFQSDQSKVVLTVPVDTSTTQMDTHLVRDVASTRLPRGPNPLLRCSERALWRLIVENTVSSLPVSGSAF
jgi:hypothetical protein